MPTGRLKLRIIGDGSGELIHYYREDAPGPRPSLYRFAPTSDPASLRAILTSVLGVLGVVRKRRRLNRVGQTRCYATWSFAGNCDIRFCRTVKGTVC